MIGKRIMQVIGLLAVLMGLLWVGQGLGVVRWPAESFMVDTTPWAWRGALLAGGGALLFIWSSRRRP